MKNLFLFLFLTVAVQVYAFDFTANKMIIEQYAGENKITLLENDSVNAHITKHPKAIVVSLENKTEVYRIVYEYLVQNVGDSVLDMTFNCRKEDKCLVKYIKTKNNNETLIIDFLSKRYTFYKTIGDELDRRKSYTNK